MSGDVSIKSDYSLSVDEVYIQDAELLLSRAGGVDVLSFCARNDVKCDSLPPCCTLNDSSYSESSWVVEMTCVKILRRRSTRSERVPDSFVVRLGILFLLEIPGI